MEGSEVVTRFSALEGQRSNLNTVLQDIERFVVPYRGEFYRSGAMSDNEVHWDRPEIYDSTAIVASKSLASKIHGSLTSPAVRWFGLRFRDDELNSQKAVMEWLEDTEGKVWQAIQQSDFNTEVAEIYHDLDSFGTAVLFMEEKNNLVFEGIDFTAMPVRECYFELGPDNKPVRIYRGIPYTKLQLHDRFGLDMPAPSDVDTKEEVIFVVFYRKDHEKIDVSQDLDPTSRPVGYKYVLRKSGEVLEEGGYYEFPGMVPRWTKVSGSFWGTSPAMEMLPHIRMLNETVAQVYEARAKAIDPPLMTTADNLLTDYDITPGGLTQVENVDNIREFPNTSPLDKEEATINRMQDDVRRAFFLDQIQLKESPAMTAYEVAARQEEMARFMSPTLGRLKTDLLNPVVIGVTQILFRTGQLLPLPPGLEDQELDIEYTSPLPRAEKAEQAVSTGAWVQDLMMLAEAKPEVFDNIDPDEYAQQMAQYRGVSSKLQVGEDEREQVRKDRAKAIEQQRRLEAAEAASGALKNAAQAQQAGGEDFGNQLAQAAGAEAGAQQ